MDMNSSMESVTSGTSSKTADKGAYNLKAKPTGMFSVRPRSRRTTDFNIMIAGECGVGKTSFIQTLLLHPVVPEKAANYDFTQAEPSVEMSKNSFFITNGSEKINLTIVEVTNFDNVVNAEFCTQPVVEYIDAQLRKYLVDESGINRKAIIDTRIHTILYLVPPYGHGLKELDYTFLLAVHQKANVIVVIAKADTLTTEELNSRKEGINKDLIKHGINCFDFTSLDDGEDESLSKYLHELNIKRPLSCVCSHASGVEDWNHPVRKYPWGIVNLYEPDTSDFVHLKCLLLETHLDDLKLATHETHYEHFRSNELMKKEAETVH